jgi:hypothetical protein
MTTKAIDRDGRDAPRVELPVLCRFLRCKSAHGAIVDNTAWQLGTSTTEAYWCLATMEAFGPDDGYVHATVCQGQRSCCRRDDG